MTCPMNKKTDQWLIRHDAVLKRLLQQTDIPATLLREAMEYAIFSGGKRLRPMLVYLCGELLETDPYCLDLIAAAVEFTHCYSLIHDDLPAMDDDDMRRGRPTCHRAFDEATAILAGDALQALAVEVLLRELPDFLKPAQVIAVVSELVSASGASGMVSGQSLDLSELSKNDINEKLLCSIHFLKTGKLISAGINMVLAASNASENARVGLQEYAANLGLVFQMQDDYLDRYAPVTVLGKGRASDERNQKYTFASLYGKAALQEQIASYFQRAEAALRLFESRADDLKAFTAYLQGRSAL